MLLACHKKELHKNIQHYKLLDASRKALQSASFALQAGYFKLHYV